jgi:hypothetical protein
MSIRPRVGRWRLLVEKGIDLIVVLAEDLAMIGIGCHPLEAVNEDLDRGADVFVFVESKNAVLFALLNQVCRRGPG